MLRGQIDRAFRVKVLKTDEASCPSGPSRLEARLEGEIRRTPVGFSLRLAGEEAWCPKEGCVFAAEYLVQKRAA
ncbi:MAG: hypothetical protein ACRD1B_05985 [Thermoanaerobaculia bacterium]